MEDQLISGQNSDLNNDLVLCIDNNDNQMTRSARVQMMLLGPQINHMPSKSHMIVLFNIHKYAFLL